MRREKLGNVIICNTKCKPKTSFKSRSLNTQTDESFLPSNGRRLRISLGLVPGPKTEGKVGRIDKSRTGGRENFKVNPKP